MGLRVFILIVTMGLVSGIIFMAPTNLGGIVPEIIEAGSKYRDNKMLSLQGGYTTRSAKIESRKSSSTTVVTEDDDIPSVTGSSEMDATLRHYFSRFDESF